METTPRPILETGLAISPLIDSSANQQAFTTTVKSTAQAPPPPATAPASSTFTILPDSFQPGTFSPFRDSIRQKIYSFSFGLKKGFLMTGDQRRSVVV